MSIWKKLRARIPDRLQLDKRHFIDVHWSYKIQNDETMGICDHEKKLVVLKLGMGDKDTVSTYIHELAHAVSDKYEIGMTEEQIRKFEEALYYILKPGNVFKD